jgi:uncharacterized membrane protein
MMVLLTFVSCLGAGLAGGVFFAFSTFVMPALGRLPPAQGVAAMQAINVAAINAPFMGTLVGTAATSAAVAVLSLLRWPHPGSGWALAGGLLCLAGIIGITRACNIPRNNALADVPADSTQAAALWQRYLVEWTAWNHARTGAGLLAAALLLLATIRARP